MVGVNVNSVGMGVHVCGFTQVCGMVVGTSHHGNSDVLPPVIDRQAAKERVSSCHGYLWPQVNISIDFSRNHTVMCMNKPHLQACERQGWMHAIHLC